MSEIYGPIILIATKFSQPMVSPQDYIYLFKTFLCLLNIQDTLKRLGAGLGCLL